jgi:hypothetical protein
MPNLPKAPATAVHWPFSSASTRRVWRGPVALAPQLARAERAVFFDHLRDTIEAATQQGGAGALLHRQALYLTSYDQGPDAAAWTAHTLHRRRDVLARRGWSSHWAEARSTATALARLGDPQPLLDFIDRALVDDDTAGLRGPSPQVGGRPFLVVDHACPSALPRSRTPPRDERIIDHLGGHHLDDQAPHPTHSPSRRAPRRYAASPGAGRLM